MLFAGVFILSATDVSAEEGDNQNTIRLEIGKEQTQTKIIRGENGEEEGRVTITELPQDDGMFQTLGSTVVSPNIRNRRYSIEWSRYAGLVYAKYTIDVENIKIVNASNVLYRLPFVSVNSYSLTHSDLLATLDMNLSTDVGGLGTLGSWTGRLQAFIGQGSVVAIWN